MKIKNKMKFLSPDEGGGGGDGTSKGAQALSTDAPAKVDEVKETAAPTTVVDAKALAQEFGDVLSKFKPTAAEPTTPKTKKISELSAEEAAKELNVWDPPDDWYTRYDNLDTRKQAIKEMRDGIFKHADTVMQRRLKEALEPYEGKLGSVDQFMSQYQNDKVESAFEKKYPELAKDELADFRQTVINKLDQSGKKFKTVGELVTAIGTEMEAAIKVVNPNFKLTAGSSPAKPKKEGQNANAIPVTSGGSGGNSASKEGDKPAVSRGQAIFA